MAIQTHLCSQIVHYIYIEQSFPVCFTAVAMPSCSERTASTEGLPWEQNIQSNEFSSVLSGGILLQANRESASQTVIPLFASCAWIFGMFLCDAFEGVGKNFCSDRMLPAFGSTWKFWLVPRMRGGRIPLLCSSTYTRARCAEIARTHSNTGDQCAGLRSIFSACTFCILPHSTFIIMT